jgi:hypothetical protein
LVELCLQMKNPVAVANEFATMLNNKQTYNGFYSNAPVAPVANLSDAQLEAQRLNMMRRMKKVWLWV